MKMITRQQKTAMIIGCGLVAIASALVCFISTTSNPIIKFPLPIGMLICFIALICCCLAIKAPAGTTNEAKVYNKKLEKKNK